MLSPEQRRARARIAGLSCHALGRTNVGPATIAAEARFRKQVIADAEARGESLTDRDIERRTVAARKLFFARLAFASAKARSARSRDRAA